VTAVAVVR